MKFVQVLKSVALASALVAGSSFAQTQTFVNDGSQYTLANGKTYYANSQLISGFLHLSDNADALMGTTDPNYATHYHSLNSSSTVATFDTASVAISGVGGGVAIRGTDTYLSSRGKTSTAQTINVTAPIHSLTADITNLSAAQATHVAVLGGLTQTAPQSGVADGGSITIQNLDVDILGKQITADVTYFDQYQNINVAKREVVFTFASITGPTSFDLNSLAPGQSQTFTNRIDHLALTTAAHDDIVTGLGLLPGTALTALNGLTDIGYLSSTLTISAAVPEPSTYALMGLGLAAAGFVARRRARQA